MENVGSTDAQIDTAEFDVSKLNGVYLGRTIDSITNKLSPEDPDYQLLQDPYVHDKLWDILDTDENRRLIEDLPLTPNSVLFYIGFVASCNNIDLRSYNGITDHHKRALEDKLN